MFGQNFVSQPSRLLLGLPSKLQLLLPMLQTPDVIVIDADRRRGCDVKRVGNFVAVIIVVVTVRLIEDVLAFIDHTSDLLLISVTVFDEAEVSIVLRGPPEDGRLVALKEHYTKVDGIQSANVLKIGNNSLDEINN